MAEEGETKSQTSAVGENDNNISNFTDDPANEGEIKNDKETIKTTIKETNNKERNRKQEKNPKTIKLNMNTVIIIATIVVGIIGVVLYQFIYNYNITPSTIKDYECPHSPIYIPTNGKRYDIDAFTEITSNTNVECEWEYKNSKKPKTLLVSGRKTCKLQLRNTMDVKGQLDVKLIVKSGNNNILCPLKLIFHSVPYFGIDLGTTFSSISYQTAEVDSNDKRKYEIIVLDRNSYSIPTAIYIPANNYDSIEIGQSALDIRYKYPENVIYDIKRI
eukprot:117997_1